MAKDEQMQLERGHDDVKIIKRTVVYDGYFSIAKFQVQHRLFSG